MHRLIRWTGIVIATLLLLVIGCLGGTWLWLGSDSGHRFLEAKLQDVLGMPGHPAVVSGLGGQLPFHPRLAHLALPDRNGPWLILDDAALDIDAGALWHGVLRIDSLSAGSIAVSRMPEAQPTTTQASPGFSLPKLPLALELGRLDIAQISLAPPVLGQKVTATLAATASLHEGRAATHLDLHRTDGIGGFAKLDLAYGDAGGQLVLGLHVTEPTGALLAELDPAAGKRPLALDLSGAGTLKDWSGGLMLTAGRDVRVESDVHLRRQDRALGLALNGDARLQPLLPDSLRAPLGRIMPFAVALSLADGKPVRLDGLRLHMAAADLDATGDYDTGHGTLGATVAVLARLERLSGLAGQSLAGQAQIVAHLSGLAAQPNIVADIAGRGLAAQGYGVDHVALHATASPNASDGRIHLVIGGGVQGLTQDGKPLPSGLGGSMAVSIDATTDPALTRLTLATGHVNSPGLDIDLKGGMARAPGTPPAMQGHAAISIADLGLLRDLAGMQLGGKADLTLDADAAKGDGTTGITLSGTIERPKTGVAALDALLGQMLHIDADATRAADGKLVLSRAILKADGVAANASGSLDAAKRLSAVLKLDLPDLGPLGRAVGTPAGGAAVLDATASGTLANPAIHATVTGKAIRSGSLRLDTIKLLADMPSLAARRASLAVTLTAAKMDGKLSAEIAQAPGDRVTIGSIQLAGPGARADGALTIDLKRRLVTGAIHGDVQDLGPWLGLAGVDGGGRAYLNLSLIERNGQGANLDAGVTNATLASARTGFDRLQLHAQLGNLLTAPKGTLALDIGNLRSGDASIAKASLRAASGADGAFDFTAGVNGRWHNPLNLTLAGTAAQIKGGANLRLNRLQANLGNMPFRLRQPLVASNAGGALRLDGLDLMIGQGNLSGMVRRDARGLTLDLTGRDVPIGGIASQAGQPGIGGTMKLTAHIAGPFRSLAGQLDIAVPDLKLAAAEHPELPPLDMTASAHLSGGVATLQGQITTLRQESVKFQSTLPLVVAKDGSDVSLNRHAPLNAAINGSGELTDIASVMPLGEDRLSGKFSINLNVTGTLDQPQAGGALKIQDGSYDSMASGMTLRHLLLDLEGNQTALEIRQLAADDGGSGKLTGAGRIKLDAGDGPALDLSITMNRFTATRLDEATIVATGRTTVTGTSLAPHIAGAMTIDHADIAIPDRLPPNIPTLQVTRINSKAPHAQRPPPPIVPPVTISFAETLKSSGQVFVRGRGLDSEWRSDIAINGTGAAPVLTGVITAVHGNFSVLGKIFTVQSGTIRFNGGNSIDPQLDLTAQRVASDTTVTVAVSGTVDKPKLTLSAIPALPQDEILARVLFGEGVSQMSPVQALQLAQAVASMSGQGPDILGSLRSATGLDQLGVTSGAGTGSGAGAMTGTTISGGKYVAPGVFLGADRGIGPGTTRGRLEVEVSPHITLNAALGAASTSSNLGVEYHLDY